MAPPHPAGTGAALSIRRAKASAISAMPAIDDQDRADGAVPKICVTP